MVNFVSLSESKSKKNFLCDIYTPGEMFSPSIRAAFLLDHPTSATKQIFYELRKIKPNSDRIYTILIDLRTKRYSV